MSSNKRVIINPEEGSYAPFTLANFADASDAKEEKKKTLEERFKPDQADVKQKEFVLGGFNFEYTHGYRADEILKKTTDQVDKMLADAKETVIGIEKEAHDKGYKDGHEEGRKAGYEEVALTMKSLKNALDNLVETRDEFFQKAEKEMVDLIVLVSSEIIHREIKEDNEIIKDVIRNAVQEITTKQFITIKLHPVDIEIVKVMGAELVETIEAVEGVEFKSDPSVAEGGCLIETNIGSLDATVESRLMSVFKTLRAKAGM